MLDPLETFLVLSPDVILACEPDGLHYALIKTTTGTTLSCAPDSFLPLVAGFFHTPKRRGSLAKFAPPFATLKPNPVEELLSYGFLEVCEKRIERRWDAVDPIDFALHRKAGWHEDPEASGREIFSRLQEEPPRFKIYPGAETVDLPPVSAVTMSLDAVLRLRRTQREFGKSPVSLSQISTLLHHAAGLHGYLPAEPFADVLARPFPSGGGRHPLEIYLIIRSDSVGLPAGIFHYNLLHQKLELINKKISDSDVQEIFRGREHYCSAPLLIMWSALWHRRAFKYRHTVMRNILVESGALLQNLCLVATAMGLGACPFDVVRIPLESFLGLNSITEPLLLGLAVGYPLDLVELTTQPRNVPSGGLVTAAEPVGA
jgi:SagB-type dehydrogenase family enzyme